MFPLVLLQVKAVGVSYKSKDESGVAFEVFPLVLLQVKAVGKFSTNSSNRGEVTFPLVLLQVKAVGLWCYFVVTSPKKKCFH